LSLTPEQFVALGEQPPFVGKSLRFFISYHHSDGRLAGKIKESLEEYGAEVFVAHDDLQGGVAWQNEVLRSLKQADVFVAVLTPNFRSSKFTDQEIGVAVSEQKLIIPLMVDRDSVPHGFISPIQGFRFQFTRERGSDQEVPDCDLAAADVVNHILATQYRPQLVDSIIRAFINSSSFVQANSRVKFVEKIKDSLSPEHVLGIIREGFLNRQIYDGNVASRVLRETILPQHSAVNPEMISELTTFLNR